MSVEIYQHKQGDSFDVSDKARVEANGEPITDFTDWTFACQIRTGARALVAELTCEWLDASQGLMRMHAPEGTAAWQIGTHDMDIQFVSPSGVVVSTPTERIEIVQDVTR